MFCLGLQRHDANCWGLKRPFSHYLIYRLLRNEKGTLILASCCVVQACKLKICNLDGDAWKIINGRPYEKLEYKCWCTCLLCQDPLETTNHLFFKCHYSKQVWKALMKGVMWSQFTVEWESLVRLITESSNWSRVKFFISRYMLQSTNKCYLDGEELKKT